jgi:hypothetical protein
VTAEEKLRAEFQSIDVNEPFTEAVVLLRDGSRLCFCHRVGERWAKAFPIPSGGDGGTANELLGRIALFRLNGKHLDVQFQDGSRWEYRLRPGR